MIDEIITVKQEEDPGCCIFLKYIYFNRVFNVFWFLKREGRATPLSKSNVKLRLIKDLFFNSLDDVLIPCVL